MATKNRNQGTVAALAQSLSAGVTKHLGNVTSMTLAGSSYTPSQVTTKLAEVVSLRSDVDAAKATTKAKLAAEKAAMPALRTFMSALVTYIKAGYGSQPDVLADFGIQTPKARAPLTVEAKAAASAKRAATRAARNTMGSKQKKGVKGNVVGVTVTPVTAPPPIAKADASGTSGTSGPSGPSAGTNIVPVATTPTAASTATPPHAT
jgi:hypothetical protein